MANKNHKIRVCTFTRKVLIKNFGAPIHVSKRHILFPFIIAPKNASKPSEWNDNIIITTSSEYVIKNPPSIFLKRYCLNLMNQFVYTHVLCGREAAESLRQFYQIHDLEEDDISFESAYKSWQRYFNNISQLNKGNNTDNSVPFNSPSLTIDQMEQILGQYVLKNINGFITTTNTFKNVLISQARIFIYYNIGQLKMKQVSKLIGITVKNCYKHKYRFHNKITKRKILPAPTITG